MEYRTKISPSVLIIEDNEMFLSLASEMLSEHISYTAKDGETGIKKYKENKPDITFLDIGLPDKDGHAVLKEIMAINPDAFVVMLTASNLKNDVKSALAGGAKGYIVKPFSRKKIKESIDQYKEHKNKVTT